MLEELFEDEATRRRLVDHPLGPWVESYAATRATLGYARSTVRGHLWPLAEFGRWLGRNAIAVGALNEAIVERYLDKRRARRRCGPNHRTALYHGLEHLRAQQVIPPAQGAVARSAMENHNPYQRIAKHPPHCRQRTHPSEPIRVLQPSPFAHREIMPSFSLYSKLSNPWPAGLFVILRPIFYPHDFLKTH